MSIPPPCQWCGQTASQSSAQTLDKEGRRSRCGFHCSIVWMNETLVSLSPWRLPAHLPLSSPSGYECEGQGGAGGRRNSTWFPTSPFAPPCSQMPQNKSIFPRRHHASQFLMGVTKILNDFKGRDLCSRFQRFSSGLASSIARR